MKVLTLAIICLIILSCQNKIHNEESKNEIIDISNIDFVSVFCNNFYREIDNYLIESSDKKMLHKSIKEVLKFIKDNHPMKGL